NRRPFRTRTGGDGRNWLLRYIEGDRKKARASFLRSQRQGAIPPTMQFNPNVIFYTNRGTPMNNACIKKYWNRRLIALGYIKLLDNGMYGGNRYGYHRHLLRSLFSTQWSKSPVKNWLADAFMGYITDPNGYNRAQTDLKWVAKEYRKVLPWLNIMSSNIPFDLYDEENIEDKINRETDRRVKEQLELEKAKIRDLIDVTVDQKFQELDKRTSEREDRVNLLEYMAPL
ncbi:hypothetical protein KA005_71920, partial [bacterium]|nr:hypothetical protein [bacterium]